MVPHLLLCCKNDAKINVDQNVKNTVLFVLNLYQPNSLLIPIYSSFRFLFSATTSVPDIFYLFSVDSDLVKALLTNPKSVLSMVSASTALLFLLPQAAATAGVVLDL